MHFDAHVHSTASPDSELIPWEAIQVLKSKGLGVIFTEHVDFTTPTTGKDLTASDAPKNARDFVCDFDIYPSQYRGIRSDSVLLGLEIGLNAAYLPLNTQVADNDYDYILGSIHFVEGYDIYTDASKMDAESFCRLYLIYARQMVELCGFFDSLAHIDYITRYCEKINKLFHYNNFPEEFDDLLQALADRELALEINTSKFGDNNTQKQLLPIYKRFKALGGQYVTIGSDAHSAWGLGRYYAKALGLANIAKLTPVYYKQRKRFVCE